MIIIFIKTWKDTNEESFSRWGEKVKKRKDLNDKQGADKSEAIKNKEWSEKMWPTEGQTDKMRWGEEEEGQRKRGVAGREDEELGVRWGWQEWNKVHQMQPM